MSQLRMEYTLLSEVLGKTIVLALGVLVQDLPLWWQIVILSETDLRLITG